ncbi:MAG: hypothetical protein DRN04_18335 [Thermoprotei archaeon]|nr:MAG: hypothetical protein DRN04_18335 [Thermoprotei archaeon]
MVDVSGRLAEIEVKLGKVRDLLFSLELDLIFLNNLLSAEPNNKRAMELKEEIECLLRRR